jgi:hypothetical protein
MEAMMEKRALVMLIATAAWIVCYNAPAWSQAASKSAKEQPTAPERSGEEKMDARGAQSPGRMERKKGEEEMEARGAQKPGRMGKTGAEAPENQTAKAWSKQDISKAQEALRKHGHNPGSVDGMMGPQTRKAIRDFQSASGLKPTGNLDTETAQKLAISAK